MKNRIPPNRGDRRGFFPVVLAVLGWLLAGPAMEAVSSPPSGSAAKPAAGRDQTAAIRRLLDQPGNRPAVWGVAVLDLQRDRLVVDIGADRLLVPASIMKLLTGYGAMEHFGPDHRFETRFSTTGKLGPDGVLRGPLIMEGGGDPSWSNRFFEDDFDRPVQALADALLARCRLSRIEGGIIADDSRFLLEPHGPDWSWETFQWAYGSRVSALVLNDNVMQAEISGDRKDRQVEVVTRPAFYRESVHASVTLLPGAGAGDLVAFKDLGRDEYFLSGAMAGGTRQLRMAVSDPALYAGRCLREELIRRGVAVTGDVMVRHRTHYTAPVPLPGPAVLLAAVPGLPLRELMEPVMKKSVNLYAELLLRNLGVAVPAAGESERRAGIKMLYGMFKDGIRPDINLQMEDGSGLSPRNLVTPRLITRILARAHQSPRATIFRDLLPLAGEDGTLQNRLGGRTRARVWAKTGQIANTASLAGYIRMQDGRWLAFCLIANNHPGHKTMARETLDKIVRLF